MKTCKRPSPQAMISFVGRFKVSSSHVGGLWPHGHNFGFLAGAESLDLIAAESARGSAKRIISQVGVTLGRGRLTQAGEHSANIPSHRGLIGV